MSLIDWTPCEYWTQDNGLTKKNCTGAQICCKTGCFASCPDTTRNDNNEHNNHNNHPNDDNRDSKYPWYLWVILANVVVALLVVAYFWWRRINARNSGSRHHSHSLPSYSYAQAHNCNAGANAGGAPKSIRFKQRSRK